MLGCSRLLLRRLPLQSPVGDDGRARRKAVATAKAVMRRKVGVKRLKRMLQTPGPNSRFAWMPQREFSGSIDMELGSRVRHAAAESPTVLTDSKTLPADPFDTVAPRHPEADSSSSSLLLATRGNDEPEGVYPLQCLDASDALARAVPLTPGITVGKDVTAHVDRMENFPSIVRGSEVSALRSRLQKLTTAPLPPHLEKLFHKITGMRNELRETDVDGELIEAPVSSSSAASNQPDPKRLASRAREKLQYGALMDTFEKDRFALENSLELKGSKFERKMLNWAGAKLLSGSAFERNEARMKAKAALVIEGPMPEGRIPKLGRDPCPGCGAICQSVHESEPGYCFPGDVEQYISIWQEVLRQRAQYAQRMAELQRHWQTHGRRVGEEWLDFMTHDEFRAIYRHSPRPFFCARCNAMRKDQGMSLLKKQVVRAKDFSSMLSKLKERRCLIVLVVDLSDFPGSMVPDLPGMVSMNNPVIIACNKLDTINSENWAPSSSSKLTEQKRRLHSERHIKRWVLELATRFRLPGHLIKDVVPVSAKKGWNIDRLIEAIEQHSNLTLRHSWKPVPTYFVGAQNSGKSSLINSLSRRLAPDIPPHPEATLHYMLVNDEKTGAQRIVRKWHVDPKKMSADFNVAHMYKSQHADLLTTSVLPGTTVNAVAIKVAVHGSDKGRAYMFDTPGVIPHWANSSPLTLPELMSCVQRTYVQPKYYVVTKGTTLFVSGLAAIEVVKADCQVAFFVYATRHVTSAICDSDSAKEFWAAAVGGTLVPPVDPEKTGDAGRLTVAKSYLFECFSNRRWPKADIYFCGIGYVSFFTERPSDIVLRVRTAPGVVHGVRKPLRTKDMKAVPTWSKLLRNAHYVSSALRREPTRTVQKVLELTAEPVDLNAPPAREVEPVPKPSSGTASDVPFDMLIAELQQAGKIPSR